MKKFLFNRYDKDTLIKKVNADKRERRVISFYRYVKIDDPIEFRNRLYDTFDDLGILGRIYLANEGINAQFSIPVENYESLRNFVDTIPELKGIYFNDAVEDKKESFIKLAIKVRRKIVADGLDDSKFDPSDVGTHLSPLEFHKTLEEEGVIVVDLRNNYESEVGHFENAILPDVGTFREELPLVEKILENDKDKKILLYCTGGIRCEKASAYLKYKGFEKVHQLRGGIINYAKEISDHGLKSKFKGKNFVFDDRLGERITDDILTVCYTCGKPSDRHTNCANLGCHVLIVQCESCSESLLGCCSLECKDIVSLPEETQKKLRQELRKQHKYPTHHLTRKMVGK
ncbi:rhodanese-like protein [Leptospira yanagawae serovar Saopaulo str. Sao Paulo = ATCC 700523]|uniref:tRNA uridine(34) hydroxylase n=2 Tax=Leptospira yanagawae TaxID=293069 RepID=A0ABY2LWG3_9LEPT|nr:rhodanese-related sulfurtransferase [Leptospira yanagawae]EOQ88303.1 rhodanese-like protein [Leptospira yanagawae serovar Saopaulo str. Sao Paulo = ATCC 700523]TGL16400.1 rhodanese-related sulfurtransferase [Leptospira yanagawae]